ncbi:DUF456 family protein [Rhodopirellula sp. JC639]|uniref:DUF456 family protein n=1 Tax=Stieleria mannarensis TaxID=2755585 RepID=UPI00160026C3|nr:DUF456 family protein [Rhodopirellula sp. JC639]
MLPAVLLLAEHAGRWAPWLETSGVVVLAILLVIGCLVAWATNLIALPGNWFCVLLLALYAWLGPASGRLAIGYGGVLAGFVLALAGELFEFLAGAAGAKRAGASRKSTLYSIIGSMAGAITGAIVGVPVPVIGSVIAAILFGGIGAAAGAMYGEWTNGRTWKENWSVGHSTFWGRTFGTLGKVVAGLFIVILVIAAILV